MANKRNRQKQRNSSKTLEGYEKYLLQESKKWEDALNKTDTMPRQREVQNNIYYYKRAHDNLRRFYFDL